MPMNDALVLDSVRESGSEQCLQCKLSCLALTKQWLRAGRSP